MKEINTIWLRNEISVDIHAVYSNISSETDIIYIHMLFKHGILRGSALFSEAYQTCIRIIPTSISAMQMNVQFDFNILNNCISKCVNLVQKHS